MTYFTAILAAPASPTSGARDWRAVDVDLDEVADVDALADALSDAADGVGEGSLVLAVLEREDEWFALARTGADGLKVFVSDLEATSTSRFADLLADAALASDDGRARAKGGDDPADEVVEEVGDEDDDEVAQGQVPDDDSPTTVVAGPSWAGDPSVLADLGVASDDLVETSEGHDPATALAVVGERVGFVDLLEALR